MFPFKKKNPIEKKANSKSGATSDLRKKLAPLVAVLTAIVFISGASVLIYKQFKHPNIKSQIESATSPIPGWWYQQYFHKSVCDTDACKPDADPDHDKLTNAQEFYYHSDPLKSHTIGDKLDDGQLVSQGIDPSRKEKMTFDQVASQDNIIGEGLVFNTDVQQIINETANISKITIPSISNAELNLTKDTSAKAVDDYLTRTKQIFDKYVPKNIAADIESAIKYQDTQATQTISMNVLKAVVELKKVPVPPDFVQLHKYTIAYLQLLPVVLNVPSEEILQNDSDPRGNTWDDQIQAFFSLSQKIEIEQNRLTEKYKNVK